ARPPARHSGRAQVLPSRDDRALPGEPGGCTRLVPAGSRPQPALLRPLGARRAEVGVMKRLVLVLAALVAFAIPANAIAHPLGNFTINRYSEVDVSGNRLYVLYVLDLAEIPTFQLDQGGGIAAAAYARRIAAGTRLSIHGKPARP